MHIFNNVFKFEKQWLIPLILAVITFYGTIRFFYYGVILNPHPIIARKILKEDKIPIEGWDNIRSQGGAQIEEFNIKRKQLYNKQVAKYFPGITCREKEELINDIKFRHRFMYHLQDIDYYSPIWVGTIGILYYVYVIL